MLKGRTISIATRQLLQLEFLWIFASLAFNGEVYLALVYDKHLCCKTAE